jgi:hypothetical protein
VVEFENGLRVYHAGDTCVFGDMRMIGELYKPDVAILPIGDFYTMGPREAAYAVGLLKPKKYVIGMHYGTFPALAGTPAAVKKLLPAAMRIKMLELKPGDEVITCATGFPTTVNPIIQIGAVPVFVDVDSRDFCIIPEKIEEYLKTGKIKYYESLKKKTPVNIEELIRVDVLGQRKVKVLYQKLGIRNIKDLEKKAKAHKIAPLFGFGEKTEKNILP